jgi:hypothetical protein
MLSRPGVSILCLLLSASISLAGPIYVSPSDNDVWTGDGPDPVAGATTGPKKTLTEALRIARLQRAAAPSATTPLVIILRGSSYELPDTVVMSALDSGTPVSPLIIRAAANEVPLLSGGTSLAAAQQTDLTWVAPVPAAFQSAPFSQLYAGGDLKGTKSSDEWLVGQGTTDHLTIWGPDAGLQTQDSRPHTTFASFDPFARTHASSLLGRSVAN